jgi:DNA-binding response OmpR family regulator
MTDRIILIADNDEQALQQLKEGLSKNGFSVETVSSAEGLVNNALARPTILVVNPDMKAFNAYDICKKLIKEGNTPVVLLLDSQSTTRALVDECEVEDVVTKPVKIELLVNLLNKHSAVTSNTKHL